MLSIRLLLLSSKFQRLALNVDSKGGELLIRLERYTSLSARMGENNICQSVVKRSTRLVLCVHVAENFFTPKFGFDAGFSTHIRTFQ